MGPNDARWHMAADELARMPDVVQRLVEAHQPDEHGLCRGCTTPGVGTPLVRWPCGLHGVAAEAVRRAARLDPAP